MLRSGKVKASTTNSKRARCQPIATFASPVSTASISGKNSPQSQKRSALSVGANFGKFLDSLVSALKELVFTEQILEARETQVPRPLNPPTNPSEAVCPREGAGHLNPRGRPRRSECPRMP